MDFSERAFKIVQKIPRGKVATYSQIAALLGSTKATRAVGNTLHKNPAPIKIPCHRVVDRNGNLAKNFAFGGLEGQKRLLEGEGIKVKDGKVDLTKYFFSDFL